MFLKTSFPSEIHSKLAPAIDKFFKNNAVVVRSSAIGEDSAKFSFAGIHESYVNVQGLNSILKHIKLVWASLFSDSAILYRKETGLDINSSKMAVIIQEFVNGEKSGVAFGKSPNSQSNIMIESVYGLNQGLVDGTVEPDRWILSRSNGNIISYTPAIKEKLVTAEKSGITVSAIAESITRKAPLSKKEVHGVYVLCKKVEKIFRAAQDAEWTYLKRTLYSLQSRPITTKAFEDKDEKRKWYLSLKRSLDNLQHLRCEIEHDLIPEMQEIAKSMDDTDLSLLTNKELANELSKRKTVFEYWRDIYWDKFIPFAHAVRLFGEIYNKQIMPDDPYEFTQLLVATGMKSLERNNLLEKLADYYNSNITAARKQGKTDTVIEAEFDDLLNSFIEKFRNPLWGLDSGSKYKASIIELLKKMGGPCCKKQNTSLQNYKKLEKSFIDSFVLSEKKYARDLLDIARVSYQLRDDDNIYLGRIEGQLHSAMEESKNRLGKNNKIDQQSLNIEEAILALKDPEFKPATKKVKQFKGRNIKVKPRQLVGQPTGEGLATGKARVVRNLQDIFNFNAGEILVCDAIDPNMTFIVPMSAGIVERRGGMLVHGAIIAREYGLPCVTGVPEAVELIETGQTIVVDGYLGIVTINKGKQTPSSRSRI
jgi:pyruvate,water dikinase